MDSVLLQHRGSMMLNTLRCATKGHLHLTQKKLKIDQDIQYWPHSWLFPPGTEVAGQNEGEALGERQGWL